MKKDNRKIAVLGMVGISALTLWTGSKFMTPVKEIEVTERQEVVEEGNLEDMEEESKDNLEVQEEEIVKEDREFTINVDELSEEEILSLDEKDIETALKEENLELLEIKWNLEVENVEIQPNTLYYFYSEYCPACMSNEETIESLLNKEIPIILINLDGGFEERYVADKIGLTSIPYLMLTDENGEIKEDLVGTFTIEDFEELFGKVGEDE